jgi:hypothetical protein
MDDFAAGEEHVAGRTKGLQELTHPAERMYAGQHHTRLMRGIEAVRTETPHATRLWILSAGYGLIPADKTVAPYDCTFSGMRKAELRRWPRSLSIPTDARRVLSRPFDLGLVLLSNDYLAACELYSDRPPRGVQLGGPTLFFCSRSAAAGLRALPNARVVTLGNAEARRFSCPLVSLKGELGGRVLSMFAHAQDGKATETLKRQLLDPSVDPYKLLKGEKALQ